MRVTRKMLKFVIGTSFTLSHRSDWTTIELHYLLPQSSSSRQQVKMEYQVVILKIRIIDIATKDKDKHKDKLKTKRQVALNDRMFGANLMLRRRQ